MMDDCINFDGSITPPDSPTLMQLDSFEFFSEGFTQECEVEKRDVFEDIPCFNCSKLRRGQGSCWLPSPNGYMTSGALYRLLHNVDPGTEFFVENEVKLFGHRYITSEALFEKPFHLFCIARQHVSAITRLITQNTLLTLPDSILKEVSDMHKDLQIFFLYVRVYLYRYFQPPNLDNSFVSDQFTLHPAVEQCPALLFGYIQQFILFVGRLSNLPSATLHKYATSTNTGYPIYNSNILFHLHLDLHWNIITILDTMHQKLKGTQWESDVASLLNSQMEETIQDLVFLASLKMHKISQSEMHRSSPCPCGCLQEFYCLMAHLLENRNSSFWGSLQIILEAVIEEKNHFSNASEETETVPVAEDNPIGLTMWLTECLAPLLFVNQYGNRQEDQSLVKHHWPLISGVIRKIFANTSQPPSEAVLQSYLKSILTISYSWEPNMKGLIILWDFFSKKMNQKLQVSVVGLQGLATINKTAISWYESCYQRSQDDKASLHQETSFLLYVRILAVQLTKLKDSQQLQHWKQVHGRFYSKFHRRYMTELDETGLTRFFSLFLTLAIVLDINDVTSRVLDILEVFSDQTVRLNRQEIIVRGLFALCLAHEKKSCDLSVPADWLVKTFNESCRSFKQDNVDPTKRANIGTLVNGYLDGVQDVVESSQWLHLSEEKFIGAGFSSLLSGCSESELRYTLTFVQTIMTQYRMLYTRVLEENGIAMPSRNLVQRKHGAMAKALWDHICPSIKMRACSQSVPPQIADVAASFTLLAMDMKKLSGLERMQHPSPIELAQFFGIGNSRVHNDVSVRYLCHLIPNEEFVNLLGEKIGPSWQISLIQTWFRSGISHSTHSSQMQELNRLVFRLSQVKKIMNSIQTNDDSMNEEDSNPSIFDFIRAAGLYFSAANSMQEKSERRREISQLFGDVVAVVRMQIRGQKSQEELGWVYKVASHMVRHCAVAFHVQGMSGMSQSQLLGLLTELVLFPGLYNPKKVVPPQQLMAVRETLPQIIEGLSTLNLSSDSLIRQKLKDIVNQYFHRMQQRVSPMMNSGYSQTYLNHPFQVVLYRSCSRQPHPQSVTLRYYILTSLRDSFLGFPGQSNVNPHLNQVILFLVELLRKTLCMQQIVRDCLIFLKPILEHLLLSDQSSIKQGMNQLLLLLMEGCKRCTPSDYKQTELLAIFKGFLSVYMYTHQGVTFKVLESAAALHSDLLVKLIPDCSEHIGRCEHKRAVGCDRILRKTFAGFLRHLGPSGQAVITKIQNNEDL